MSDIYICHCTICCRSTGSSGIAVGIVAKDKFLWTRGEKDIGRWSKPGHDWETCFCMTCGSTLPGENDKTRMYVPVGLLTAGAADLKVVHHLYVDSKADWYVIGDSGKQHKQGYSE